MRPPQAFAEGLVAEGLAAQGPGAGLGGHDRWLFYALLVLLVWAPLPLGSNRPWARALLEVGVFTLTACWLVQALGGRVWLTDALVKARWAMLFIGVWLGVGLLQLVPLPIGWLQVLSPAAAGHWQDSALAWGTPAPGWAPASLDPNASLEMWRLGAALALLWLLPLVLVRSRRRLRLLAWTLVLAALAQATLASLLALRGTPWLFIEGSVRAHGTFANPNHLAGYLEMSIALGLGLLIADLSDWTPDAGWRRRLRGWVKTLLGRKAQLRIYLAVLVVALVLTASRMGNIAFFASLGVAAALGLAAYRNSRRPVLVLLLSLLVVDLLILGSWFGLDRLRDRLTQTVLTEDARFEVGVRGAAYFADFPLLGSGGGSFSAVYPIYREPDSVPLHFEHADNDLLELSLEYGLLGMIPLTLFVVLCLLAAIRVLQQRKDPLCRGMALASLMGVTAILIHSAADANLHIPANAALFMVLLAMPWVALTLGSDP